ncbi:uncharacterized protein BX664DRAFT_326831, partial [Halteromyces radiatus]|uniref:uncharacterized protein n=1 Tax=Halteromyces radiatus TaxID=101107 RepID=UPI00221FBEDA
MIRRPILQFCSTSKRCGNTVTQSRWFSSSINHLQQQIHSTEKTTSYKSPDPLQFPWLLSTASPRIKDYPYIKAPSDWGFLNVLPIKLQHALCQWLGYRMLQLNMGDTYFPDQFLLGASHGTRKALDSISQFLTEPSDESMKHVNELISPRLQQALLGQAEGSFGIYDKISISLPQIYDARVGDIWVTLGNVEALEKPRQYEVVRWMTLMVAMKRAVVDEAEEPFADFRKRVGAGLMEGAHVAVDVEIDADVRYQVLRPKSADEASSLLDHDVVLFDQGRRTLLVRFESPYFVPANAMVSGRDEYTGEPLNDWHWRISDIDHLVEKQDLDAMMDD